MRFVIFTHSVESDWNHGNAHFLRGLVTDLMIQGHRVDLFEPADGWSRRNLLIYEGHGAIDEFRAAYPHLRSTLYDISDIDLNRVLGNADVVLVHEWNPPELVERIGRHHQSCPRYRLLFHDTHHRSLSDRASIAAYDLTHYDGVLAFGAVIRDLYLESGWSADAWTWHEAADTRIFRPLLPSRKEGDLVWIGNWGDGERAESIREFLIEPVRRLRLRAHVYGVRYPEPAVRELRAAGIEYRGWLPNYKVPQAFGRYRATVHIPRRPYVESLCGIPTIRVFEALACGIPLVSAPWRDTENLFRPGDFLYARDGEEMTSHLDHLVSDYSFGEEIGDRGLRTILARHTCTHRANELLQIVREPAAAKAAEGRA
jgi:spore maturation protein CgeB